MIKVYGDNKLQHRRFKIDGENDDHRWLLILTGDDNKKNKKI